MNTNFATFAQLIKRDLYVLRPRLKDKLIDGAFVVATQVLLFGHLMPLIGMPTSLIGPLFIGTIIQLCISVGYGLSLKHMFDLEHNRFINYQLTLPLSTSWLFATFVINFMIEVAFITLPLFTFGIILLGTSFVMIQPNFFFFAVVYVLSLALLGSLLLSFSFIYSFRWFFDNLWPRRISPLFLFGSVLFPWKRVWELNPWLGGLFLCNPLTYIAESFRSTLIGGDYFIPTFVCIPALIFFICISMYLFNRGVVKRLDPV